jgi:hypothetical protein
MLRTQNCPSRKTGRSSSAERPQLTVRATRKLAHVDAELREHLFNIALGNALLFGCLSARYQFELAAMGGIIHRRPFTPMVFHKLTAARFKRLFEP